MDQILSLQAFANEYGLSIKKATRLAKDSGALLPRAKGQKYYIIKEKFERYLKNC